MKTHTELPFDPVAEGQESLAAEQPDFIAQLALLAPDAGAPSRSVLAAANLRIDAQPRAGFGRVLQKWMPWAGWGAAAMLTGILVIEPTLLVPVSGGRTGEIKVQPGTHNMTGDGATYSKEENGIPGASGSNADVHTNPDSVVRTRNMEALRMEYEKTGGLTAIQDFAHLKHDLEKLRAAHQARFQSTPQLSRTVVVEMTDPASAGEAERLTTLKLSERVAESIAAGVDRAAQTSTNNEPSPAKKDLVLSGGDGSWTGDLVIEKGFPNTGMLNLPDGTQIKHLDFPLDAVDNIRGLMKLGEGWFYDQFSDVLWQPTGQGRQYVGGKAPAGFDAETFQPPSQSVTQPSPTHPQPQPETQIAAEPPAPPVRGYPIFDETTGAGSIILQNLPEPPPDQTYQLWVTDASSTAPISIGMIPQLEQGNGRVWYDLGGPGVAPSGYLLTLEPTGGSRQPGNHIVLKGP